MDGAKTFALRFHQQSRAKHKSQLRRTWRLTLGIPSCSLLTPWSEILSLIPFLISSTELHLSFFITISVTGTANSDLWEVSSGLPCPPEGREVRKLPRSQRTIPSFLPRVRYLDFRYLSSDYFISSEKWDFAPSLLNPTTLSLLRTLRLLTRRT